MFMETEHIAVSNYPLLLLLLVVSLQFSQQQTANRPEEQFALEIIEKI